MQPQPDQYTEAQKTEIKERADKAYAYLKENDLEIRTIMQAENIKDDIFGIKPYSYLQDVRYTPKLSPIQKV